MLNRLCIIPVFMLLCAAALQRASADVIIKKNGERIEGKLVLELEDKLFIEQEGGTVITLPRVEFDRLEAANAEHDAGTQRLVDRVLERQQQDQHQDALRLIIQETAGKPELKQILAPHFEKSLDQLFAAARGHIGRSQFREARETYLLLFQIVVGEAETTIDLFQSPESWNKFRKDLSDKLADCNLALAQQAVQSDAQSAHRYLDEITSPVQGLQPLDPRENLERWLRIMLTRGEALEREARDREALKLYEQTQKNHVADSQIQLTDSYKELNQRINQLHKRFATPAPVLTPTPDPTAVEIARAQAREQAEIQRKQEERIRELQAIKARDERPLAKKVADFTGDLATAQFWSKFGGDLTAGVYLPHIALICGALLLLWWLPRNLTLFLLRRGVSEAGEWYGAVRKFGIFAFILLLLQLVWVQCGEILAGFKGVQTKRQSRPRCPNCRKHLDNIEAYKDMNFVICPHCHENITPVYNIRDYLVHLIEQVELTMMSRRHSAGQSDQQLERDAMMKLISVLFTVAVRERATDLHVSAEEDGMAVRVRVDGTLRNLAVVPKTIGPLISSALMVMANLDITERQVPQDGRFSITADGHPLEIRINSSPNPHGDNISMRLLDNRRIQLGTQQLGLEGPGKITFEKVINSPHGLILVTGPTGSGKSTTLYVALHLLNTGDKNIITIEDPIEYKVKGLNQQQVNVARNFTFATGLRSILRQDPDVIMVGEIRDRETAEISIEASLTGHLVLTTLHTIDAPSAISRLRDLGIEPRRYAPALSLVLAQRLIRLICKNCRAEYKPDIEFFKILEFNPPNGQKYYHGTGCPQCAGTGFYGRSGIFEVLLPKDELRTLLESPFTTSQVREWARKNGMRTLREMGIEKIVRQLTTMDEVIRVTS